MVQKLDYADRTAFYRISGTTAEVLTKAASLDLSASKIIYFFDAEESATLTTSVMIACLTA